MKRNTRAGGLELPCVLFVFCIIILNVLRIDSALHKSTASSLIDNQLRIAVLSPPEMGHYNSQSGLIEELVRRGHNVTLFLSKPCHHWVNLKNITIVDAGEAMPQHLVDEASHVNLFKVLVAGLDILFRMDSDIEDAIIRELENNPPDLIISDLILKSGVKFSLRKKLPLVFTCPFLYPNPWVKPFWNPMITSGLPLSNKLHHRMTNYIAIQLHRWVVGIFMSLSVNFHEHSLFGAWEFPTIVSMNWGVDHAYSLPPYVFYVGSTRNFEEFPPLRTELGDWLNRNVSEITVYVSMGTVSHQNPEQLEIMLIGLFRTPGRRVLWTLRKDHHHYVLGFCQRLKSCTEDNFRLESHVSQLAVLSHPNVKLFVSHGGANSVLESIHFAKPLICLPLFGDQLDMCQRASDKGFGYQINPKTMTSEDLDNGMNRVLHEPSYLKIVQTLSLINRAAGGAPRAVDIIETLAVTGHEYLLPFETKLPWYQKWDLDIFAVLALVAVIVCFLSFILGKCVFGKRGCSLSQKDALGTSHFHLKGL